MKHQKDIIHIPLIEDSKVMELLLVGEQVPDRMELLSPLTYFCDHEELSGEALREEEACFVKETSAFHNVRPALTVTRMPMKSATMASAG